MKHLQQRFRVSERRACRVVGQPRSSQRHVSEKVTKDAALSERIVSISRENPHYGYRRVWALLRREGWEVNKKRVQRLWREADLKVPAKQHKRRRRSEGSSHNGCTKRRAEYPGHVWSYDFAMDSTEDGRRLKLMPVVDEYSRECLSLEVERSITAEEVVDTLRRLFIERGAPKYIRSDNGPDLAEPRLLVDDASPERLASMLAEQGGRIALMSAEGGIFDIMAGRYSQGIPNLDVYLKGHAGDALRVDRVGRKADFVRKPALTTGLAIQPDVLRGLADKPGFRGRGLLGRFLYAMPHDTLGTRGIRTAAVARDLETTYGRKIKYLLRLSPKLPDEDRNPRVLRLSAEARDEMERFMIWLEPRLAEGAELGDMTDWAGKLAGAVARIAGVLHMFDYAGKMQPWDYEVNKEVVERAIKIGHYLLAHAKCVLAFMGSDSRVEDAKYILRWIERKGCEWFTKREAFEGTKGRFDTVSDLETGLEVLIEHGYVREDPDQPLHRGPGRKPSPRYEVNPLAGGSRESK